MKQMQELYNKTAQSEELQEKLTAILKDAKKDGKETFEAKLTGFAKEAGYDLSLRDLMEFIDRLPAKEKDTELTEAELDLVAGGKSANGVMNIIGNVLTLGVPYIIRSIIDIENRNPDKCDEYFA